MDGFPNYCPACRCRSPCRRIKRRSRRRLAFNTAILDRVRPSGIGGQMAPIWRCFFKALPPSRDFGAGASTGMERIAGWWRLGHPDHSGKPRDDPIRQTRIAPNPAPLELEMAALQGRPYCSRYGVEEQMEARRQSHAGPRSSLSPGLSLGRRSRLGMPVMHRLRESPGGAYHLTRSHSVDTHDARTLFHGLSSQERSD
jgi:hypothetical protein